MTIKMLESETSARHSAESLYAATMQMNSHRVATATAEDLDRTMHLRKEIDLPI